MTLALILQVLIAAVVLFAVFAFATGWLDPMSSAEPDELHEHLPVDPTAADLEHLVLPMAARGYRMTEVDEVLDELAAALAAKDAEIAALRAAPVPVGAPSWGPPVPETAAAQEPVVDEPTVGGWAGFAMTPVEPATAVAEPVDLTKDGHPTD